LDDLHTLKAALIFAGNDAAVSHSSALWLWGLLKKPLTSPAHVSVPRSGARSHPLVRVHERWPSAMEEQYGLPVVGVREAIVGAVNQMTLDALRFPAMQAVKTGLVTAEQLADTSGLPRRALRVMRQLAEEAAAGAESGGEAIFWRLLQASPLPTPVLQHWLLTHIGWKRLDGYWEEFGLGVEIDSEEFHASKEQRHQDTTRQNAVHGCGIVIIRFWVDQLLNDPETVLSDTEINLIARGWRP
jgi:very-short-patch-repair endonuclease